MLPSYVVVCEGWDAEEQTSILIGAASVLVVQVTRPGFSAISFLILIVGATNIPGHYGLVGTGPPVEVYIYTANTGT